MKTFIRYGATIEVDETHTSLISRLLNTGWVEVES